MVANSSSAVTTSGSPADAQGRGQDQDDQDDELDPEAAETRAPARRRAAAPLYSTGPWLIAPLGRCWAGGPLGEGGAGRRGGARRRRRHGRRRRFGLVGLVGHERQRYGTRPRCAVRGRLGPVTRRPTTIAAMPDRPPTTDAQPTTVGLDPSRADPRRPAVERFGWHPEPELLGVDDRRIVAAGPRAARGRRLGRPALDYLYRRGPPPRRSASRPATPSSGGPSTRPTRRARATVPPRRRSGRRRRPSSWPSSGPGSRRTSSTPGIPGR